MVTLSDEPTIACALRTGYPHPEPKKAKEDSRYDWVELSEEEFQNVILRRQTAKKGQEK